MMQYRLNQQVFICKVNGRLVFLDVKRDAYASLNLSDSQTAERFLTGWPNGGHLGPAQKVSNNEADNGVSAAELARVMLKRGFLSPKFTLGKDAHPVHIDPASHWLVSREQIAEPRPTFTEVLNFFYSCAWASAALSWRSIAWTIQQVQKRKRKRSKTETAIDDDKVRRLVATFHTLRPFYSRRYLCLFDSLALVKFLARYDVYPLWVYGVMVEPFSAHCWVQKDELSFNEAPEVIRNYTPIMTV